MAELFSRPTHGDVAMCVARYGAAAALGGSTPSLAAGIAGLCARIKDLRCRFHGVAHAFEVILHGVRAGQTEKWRAPHVQQKVTVDRLIDDLRREIPRTYLHIPDSLQFVVGTQRLTFRYWMERLVEFTEFNLKIGATIPWKQNFEVSDKHPDAYELRLFVGFDCRRIVETEGEAKMGEKREGKNVALHFYSRKLGRLIKTEPDARHILGLSTGGTLFCSALTVIVDDVGGRLPLHPTKQEVSFGLEKVHRDNLFAWVGSVTKFYYRYHLKKYNNLKKVLSCQISQYAESQVPIEVKTYNESHFTSYQLTFEQYRDTIRVDPKVAKEIVGTDTYFRLHPVAGATHKHPAQSRKKTTKRSTLPLVSHQEKHPDSDAETTECHMKTERMKQSNKSHCLTLLDPDQDAEIKGAGCIDLCESCDEDNHSVSHDVSLAESMNAKEELEADRAELFAMGSKTGKAKICRRHDLERATKRLKHDYEAKIAVLEKENAELKEHLLKKDKIISVLKRRLCG